MQVGGFFYCIFWRQQCYGSDLAWEFVFPHQWGWTESCLVVGLSEINLSSETGKIYEGCGKPAGGAQHHLGLAQCHF